MTGMKLNLPAVKRVVRTLACLTRDRRGATAIEYGLILAFMVVAMIVGLSALANSTSGMWNHVSTRVVTAGGTS
jgi:pilus assembly protein Flp/PilA